MSRRKWQEVCRQGDAFAFLVADYCDSVGQSGENPIDSYLSAAKAFVRVAGVTIGPGNSLEEAQHAAGRLLILGLVSEVERFFRRTLGKLVSFCPICEKHVGNEDIKVSSVIRHGTRSVGAGLLEGVSFASRRNVTEQSERIVGWGIKKKSALDKCLQDYDKLCQLRHASVHSGGMLSGANCIRLGLDVSGAYRVSIDFTSFSKATKVCHNLVRTYNSSLYEYVIQRWHTESVFSSDWKIDKHLFSSLFRLFSSRSDGVGPATAYSAYRSLMASFARQ